MNRQRLTVAGAVVFLVTVIGFGVSGLVSGGVSIATYRIERGPFVHRVEAEGVLAAEQATIISSPRTTGMPMKIAWMAEDGSHVEAGEPVVRFDPTDMEKELFTGEADEAKAEAQAQQKQFEQEAVLANLERDATLATRQLEHAQEFQTDDEEIYSRTEIIESRIDGELATQRRDHAEDLRELREVLGGVELDLLDLERNRAQITIDKARAGLRELEIRAPHSGIFVLRRDRGEPPAIGQVVWPGNELGEIPQLGVMMAQVFVLEADAGGLTPGASATVLLEAHPGQPVSASVRRVASVPKRRARWSPVQYFDVDLELAETDPERMKPGQRVRATILLHDLDDVIAIPREALFRDDEGNAYVYRRSGGDWERVPVTPGAAALGRVVIDEGLAEDDEIALQDPSSSGVIAPVAPADGAPAFGPTGVGR